MGAVVWNLTCPFRIFIPFPTPMATPSNASEPEPTDEEVEYIEGGFDPILFWDQYRQAILLIGGVVLLGLVGFGIFEFQHAQKMAAGATALDAASSEDDYRQVMDKYAGTPAGGNAALLLAGKLREDKKYDEAITVLQTFLDKYPTHELAGGAELSIGETLEEEGKLDDAVAKYQEMAAKYPDSYAAPLAVIAQANILKSQGKVDDALRLYQNFVPQFPDSVFSQMARMQMQLLQPMAGSQSAATPGGIPEMLNQGAGEAATPAAVASSPAPSAAASPGILPTLPGASPAGGGMAPIVPAGSPR
jgi:tetratricopeptide (TPR) repeat protein